jgi:hypothetical protein
MLKGSIQSLFKKANWLAVIAAASLELAISLIGRINVEQTV